MSDISGELGRSITRAVRFLRQIHQDMYQLLTSLDSLMAESGWQPTGKKYVTSGLSNGMDLDAWVLTWLFRFYVPSGSPAEFEELAAFIIWCDPPPGSTFDQPMVLATAARFPTPITNEAMWQQWKSTAPALQGLGTQPGPRPLAQKEFSSFLPAAREVIGGAVPLCGLTGNDALRSLLVEPTLTAMDQLRSRPG
jgi:hypothetical protein